MDFGINYIQQQNNVWQVTVAYLVKTFTSLLKIEFLFPATKATAADFWVSSTYSAHQLKSIFQSPVQYCRSIYAQICQMVHFRFLVQYVGRFHTVTGHEGP